VRRRLAIAGAVVVALAAAGAATVALAGGSDEAGAPTAPSATGTGTVARRTLAERVTIEGTIGYAGETTVLARVSGTVTALPAVGDVVRRGERLFAVGEEPVILMYGEVPAYRDLAEGVSEEPDVEQLERNLAALGYDPGTVDEDFTSSTAEAIDAWQENLGLEATGEVELGRVVFLPGPRRVTALEANLGEALGGGGGSDGSHLVDYETPAEPASAPEPGSEKEKEGKTPAPDGESPAEKPEEKEPKEPKEEPEEEAAEKAEEKPAKKPSHKKEEAPQQEPRQPAAEPREAEREPQAEQEPEAESEPASTPVLQTSSTRRIVGVVLEADRQSLAHRGQQVEVVLPGGAEVKGKVRRLTAVESSGEGAPGEESEAGVEATIAVTGKHRIPALDGAAVSVLFTERVRRHVLSVPLTALIAIGGERFAVIELEAGRRRRIVVTPGLAADGYVEVEGEGLEAGMKVETGG
jgi:multidrug efflux pump subunit AcrA (membrane-fusion protein)